jgi:hypothetical protein
VNVLDDDVVAVEPEPFSFEDAALADAAQGLVALNDKKVLGSLVVCDGHLDLLVTPARVGERGVAWEQDHVLPLEAVLLGQALRVGLGSASGFGSRSF